jgi:hypothetical protein
MEHGGARVIVNGLRVDAEDFVARVPNRRIKVEISTLALSSRCSSISLISGPDPRIPGAPETAGKRFVGRGPRSQIQREPEAITVTLQTSDATFGRVWLARTDRQWTIISSIGGSFNPN